jgi:hypothetical protein
MFYKLKKTLVAAALLPLALGCKRENVAPANQLEASNTATQKVQQWLKGNPKALTGLRAGQKTDRKAGTALPNLRLQWAATGFDAATHTYWVPADMANNKKSGHTANMYLVATENEQGQVTGGQYIMVLPNAKKMGSEAARGVNPAALLSNEKPKDLPAGQAGFSGAVLQYDLKGQLTGSQVFEGGQLQPHATANLAIRDEGQGSPSPNKVQQECGDAVGVNPCIDWYYQTYVNGVLLSEEYLFTTCCGGSGGGGGGSGNALAECQASFNAFVVQGAAVSGIPTVISGVQTATRWPKTYKWMIYDAVTWFLISYEKAWWKKVYYPSSGQNLWEFESFVHDRVESEGTNIGGTRSYTVIGTPEPNMQKYSTYLRIDYKVKHTPMCSLLPLVEDVIPPVELTHYSENIFRIPGSVTVVTQ